MPETGTTDLAARPPASGGHGQGTEGLLFPGESALPVAASWWTSVLVGIAASLMVVVSMAEMAAEIGNVSIWVWVVTAFVGALQSILVAELASRFPTRAGGTAQYAYRARANGSPTLGALSSWSYWAAWTPGIAVNLLMAADYLQSEFFPGVNMILLAILIGVILYTITALGLKLSTMVNTVLAVLAVVVVLTVIITPIFHPSHFDANNILPAQLPEDAPKSTWEIIGIVFKWTFIAAWAAYAAEMASTICAEIREPERHMKRIMSLSAFHCFLAFTLVPIVLFGLAGTEGLQKDPFEVFGEVGSIMLGSAGEKIVGFGLAAVLIVGAEVFIIGSSRTIYQMSQDGHLPRFFGRVNGRGAPVGSIAFDAAVIGLMLLVFGTDVVEVVAAASFGYLVVFVLLPIAYLALRRHPGGREGSFRLGKAWGAVAVGLLIFNAVLLVYGGLQWDLSVILVGIGAVLAIIPIAYLSRKARNREPVQASPDRDPVQAS